MQKHVARAVRRGLEDEGYAVDTLSADRGDWLRKRNPYDTMVST